MCEQVEQAFKGGTIVVKCSCCDIVSLRVLQENNSFSTYEVNWASCIQYTFDTVLVLVRDVGCHTLA